jgi:hypothetical protein
MENLRARMAGRQVLMQQWVLLAWGLQVASEEQVSQA